MIVVIDFMCIIVMGFKVIFCDCCLGFCNWEQLVSWVFFVLFLIVFVLFLVWLIIYGIILSFIDQLFIGVGGVFVGFVNYVEVLSDLKMWQLMGNMVWFIFLLIVLFVLIVFVMVVFVDCGFLGQWFWWLLFFMLYLFVLIVILQIWVWIFNFQVGVVNNIFKVFGFELIVWLQNFDINMLLIVIVIVWWMVGFNFLLYFVVMQNILLQ